MVVEGEVEELLRRWREGEREAMVRLLVLESAWLRQRIRRGLGELGRRLHDTDDVLQEAALRLQRLESDARISDRRMLRAYLARVVHNVIVDKQRSAGRLRRNVAREQPLESGGVVAEQAGPRTEADHREKRGWIQDSLGQLPPGEREAVSLWSRGLDFVEIGNRLGISPDAARMKRNRGLAKLVQQRRRRARAAAAGEVTGD